MSLDDRARLIRQLQRAYSGELAAAHAYAGHWRSLGDPSDRDRIRQIEEEEWHHRRLVGQMLRELDAEPVLRLEAWAGVVGRVLSVLCHVGGWFLPMYAAGKLESRNVQECEDAARFASSCGLGHLADGLLTMAEVEWDHEAYFRARITAHRGLRLLPLWPSIPPRERIRATAG